MRMREGGGRARIGSKEEGGGGGSKVARGGGGEAGRDGGEGMGRDIHTCCSHASNTGIFKV